MLYMSGYSNNSIFWVETSKVQPNPFQPRRDFEENALADLADSIRQYGVLQPLVVTRNEAYRDDGGMEVSYELIAGERRLRASKIAGLQQVPVIIRQETDEKVKLELAIIENLQREDLNPIDRALAFQQLYKEFDLTHAEIGKKMGKSRVYVSNSLRLLALPDTIKKALMERKITEGHTRPLLMLVDRPEEQATLFKEIMVKNMSVRDAEKIARKVAQDKVRKKEFTVAPEIRLYEKRMSENLGTRVHIEPKEKGGKIVIDYFTQKDLETILASINKSENKDAQRMMNQFVEQAQQAQKPAENMQQEDLTRTTGVSFSGTEEQESKTQEESVQTLEDFKTAVPAELQEGSNLQETVSSFITGNPLEEQMNTAAQTSTSQVESQEEPRVETPNLDVQQPQKEDQSNLQETVSSFITGNPLEEQSIPQQTSPEPQPAIEYKPLSREIPQSLNTDTTAYGTVSQQKPVETQFSQPEVASNKHLEDQQIENKAPQSYQGLDPYLEQPNQEKDYDMEARYDSVNNVNGNQAQQNFVQTQNAGYQQRAQQQYPPRYSQISQQPPQKKSFFKKIFG